MNYLTVFATYYKISYSHSLDVGYLCLKIPTNVLNEHYTLFCLRDIKIHMPLTKRQNTLSELITAVIIIYYILDLCTFIYHILY